MTGIGWIAATALFTFWFYVKGSHEFFRGSVHEPTRRYHRRKRAQIIDPLMARDWEKKHGM